MSGHLHCAGDPTSEVCVRLLIPERIVYSILSRSCSQTLFGSTGASTFLSKATTAAAVIFMLTSLALAYISSHRTGDSIMTDSPAPVEQSASPSQAVPADQGTGQSESTQ